MSALDINSGAGTFGKAHLAGWIPEVASGPRLFEPTTTSAAALQKMLTAGTITSSQILNEYYRQILAYNGYLKAVYQLAPGAKERAKELDARRANGDIIGPLHGIPIILKDNIGTEPSMRMENTGGTLALATSFTTQNAPIVDRLLDAGAIIMGKATLSEMMWFKGSGIRCGWSALHGQSPNPYVPGGIDMGDGLGGHSSPGGSSSGSAIAIAAGFAPMAIGTETEGSLISPATRQSLYTVKPTLGTVPNAGIIPVSCYLDIAGPICCCVEDTSNLLTVLMGKSHNHVPSGGFAAMMKGAAGWKELRIGTLDPEKFRYNEGLQTQAPAASEQIRVATLEAYEHIKELAKEYHYDVSLRHYKDFDYEGKNPFVELMVGDFASDFDKYIAGTQGSSVSSAKELAAWNEAHATVALPPEYPNQDLITSAVASKQSSLHREKLIEHIREVGKTLPETLDKYGIDAIIAPSDSWFSQYSAATGFPLCGLPIGYIAYNGRPIGLTAMARSEATLITLMSAFEASFPERKAPTAFLSHKSEV